MFLKRVLIAGLLIAFAGSLLAEHDFSMPVEQRLRFRNKRGPRGQGSCVYASISLCGAHHNLPSAEYLLEEHPIWGPPVLDGSYPERVERDMANRRYPIPIWNISGTQTINWIDHFLEQGSWVAITYGERHMITATGKTQDGSYWIVDNNYPQEERLVLREVFLREHRRTGGGWCVILKTPGPPPWTRARYPVRGAYRE